MWTNDRLHDIETQVLQQHLGSAILMMENYLLSQTSSGHTDELTAIREDYQLLADYWYKGFADSRRQDVYEQLLRRLYVLNTNIAIRERIQNTAFMSAVYTRLRKGRRDWSVPVIRRMLEDFVTNVALLEFEPEHVRRQREEELYQEHSQFMNDLFDYIWTSSLWNESLAHSMEDLLLAPTIDSVDQQFIVSAVTLSGMNHFDFCKFRILCNVYEKSSDEQLRQRALVGWVLCADETKQSLYPEMHAMIVRMCKNRQCRQELTELQFQMVYCMLADNDSQKIKNEIMPELMKGNNLKMTRQGLVELEEDKLEDILHPDAAEKNMERMEDSMRQMADMQKRGSDIYFAGFSQMKRFPFFNSLPNWFVPFYHQHPAVNKIWNNTKGHKFLQVITRLGAFCDSDKYSFVLAFDQMLSHLPAQMLTMIENGEASPMAVGGEVSIEEQRQPAFMRRVYLQNLYRFFRLYPTRSEFRNPFEQTDALHDGNRLSAAFFSAGTLFHGTEFENNMVEISSFLTKKKMYGAAFRVLGNKGDGQRDSQYYLLLGHLLSKLSAEQTVSGMPSVSECYRKALQCIEEEQADGSSSGKERALMGYARALFAEQDFRQALEVFEQLLALEPTNRNALLNASVCMVNLGDCEEATKLLYRLNYQNADDVQVNRVLAWSLTLSGRYEQAMKIYESLLSSAARQPSDYLYYGYCLWFQKAMADAVKHFRLFLAEQTEDGFSIADEFWHSEYQLLRSHGIDDIDIRIMLDYFSVFHEASSRNTNLM
jgi:tetratricopeptide (TPR) repeat protein